MGKKRNKDTHKKLHPVPLSNITNPFSFFSIYILLHKLQYTNYYNQLTFTVYIKSSAYVFLSLSGSGLLRENPIDLLHAKYEKKGRIMVNYRIYICNNEKDVMK